MSVKPSIQIPCGLTTAAARSSGLQRRLAQAGASDHKIEQTLLRGGKYIGFPTSLDAADTDA
jgi:hypothetical protein